jgi:hypothetical protein
MERSKILSIERKRSLKMNTVYNVRNRSASRVVYRIPEDGIRREFAPGETKKINGEELEKLSYQSGGREIMSLFLQIQSVEKVADLGLSVEPEYNMSEADIVELLKNGTLDAFLDCLDFAPIGVIDLVKTLSVKVPLENTAKRDALKKKTGFDVAAALANLAAEKEDNANVEEAPTRRVQTEPAQTGRRTSGSNYKIIKTAE